MAAAEQPWPIGRAPRLPISGARPRSTPSPGRADPSDTRQLRPQGSASDHRTPLRNHALPKGHPPPTLSASGQTDCGTVYGKEGQEEGGAQRGSMAATLHMAGPPPFRDFRRAARRRRLEVDAHLARGGRLPRSSVPHPVSG